MCHRREERHTFLTLVFNRNCAFYHNSKEHYIYICQMNCIEKIMLRLMILIRKKFGYKIPQLNEARPIGTRWWNIYRHHGRIVRLIPLSEVELNEVSDEQRLLDLEYIKIKSRKLDEFIEQVRLESDNYPTQEQMQLWEFHYEQENERPEYRPCKQCVFSADTPGSVLPCPYYNVVAGSSKHACCTHKYVIIKDIEKQ